MNDADVMYFSMEDGRVHIGGDNGTDTLMHTKGQFCVMDQRGETVMLKVERNPKTETESVLYVPVSIHKQTISRYYETVSDARLKTDVSTLTDPSPLDALRPVRFAYTDQPQGFHYGFLAQEVETVLPELVKERDGAKTVSYTEMIPWLMRAVQTLNTRVQDLERQLASYAQP